MSQESCPGFGGKEMSFLEWEGRGMLACLSLLFCFKCPFVEQRAVLLYAAGRDKICSAIPFPFLICAKPGGCYIIQKAEQTYLSLAELG